MPPARAVQREVFLRSPGKGVAVMAAAFYTRPSGLEMISIEERWSRSDTIDVAYVRRSADNGRTWGEAEERPTGEKTAGGMLRRHLRGCHADPRTGFLLEFWLEGVLPTDDPLEGLRQWNIYYTASRDGGKTKSAPRQVIHKGREFDARHPLPGVYTGRNAVMLGDKTSVPVFARDGSILLPVQITPLGPDGALHNPGGGYTWTEAALLHGRWRGDMLEWEMSATLKGDPESTTRGMVEPTVAALGGGRLLMVLRGSNDRKPQLPAYRWYSLSADGGMRWSEPKPWTYSTGEPFFSPSSCSQLLRHSTGRLFWLGNISRENAQGNRPRYPFYIGEVDQTSGLLIRESLRMIDDRQPGESEILTLSNFFAREDRQSKEIALHMTRLFAFKDGWQGDAMLYRIPS